MVKKHCLSLLIYVSFSFLSFSQLINLPSAHFSGLVNATVAYNDVWSAVNNPGALAQLKQPVLGMSCLNNYFLPQLQHQLGAIALPTKKGTVGIVHQQYGNQNFRLSSSGLAFAMQLNPKFHAGIQINYDQYNQGSFYGRAGFVTAQVGIFAQLSSHTSFGASVSNLGQSTLKSSDKDYLNTTIRVGIQVQVNKALRCFAQAEQEFYKGFDLKGALEYTVHERITFRTGVGFLSEQLGFGVGYQIKQFRFDLSSQYINKLGLAPALSMRYEFKTGAKS